MSEATFFKSSMQVLLAVYVNSASPCVTLRHSASLCVIQSKGDEINLRVMKLI
jgi:hypothetical protein